MGIALLLVQSFWLMPPASAETVEDCSVLVCAGSEVDMNTDRWCNLETGRLRCRVRADVRGFGGNAASVNDIGLPGTLRVHSYVAECSWANDIASGDCSHYGFVGLARFGLPGDRATASFSGEAASRSFAVPINGPECISVEATVVTTVAATISAGAAVLDRTLVRTSEAAGFTYCFD